jgi:hypothetical protein
MDGSTFCVGPIDRTPVSNCKRLAVPVKQAEGLFLLIVLNAVPLWVLEETGGAVLALDSEPALEKALTVFRACAGHYSSVDKGESDDSIARGNLSTDVWTTENVQRKFHVGGASCEMELLCQSFGLEKRQTVHIDGFQRYRLSPMMGLPFVVLVLFAEAGLGFALITSRPYGNFETFGQSHQSCKSHRTRKEFVGPIHFMLRAVVGFGEAATRGNVLRFVTLRWAGFRSLDLLWGGDFSLLDARFSRKKDPCAVAKTGRVLRTEDFFTPVQVFVFGSRVRPNKFTLEKFDDLDTNLNCVHGILFHPS